jgi:hypothetical protein
MKMNFIRSSFFLLIILLTAGCKEQNKQKSLYEYTDIQSRWSSPENRNGIAGNGGRENNRAKGHPYDSIPAGKSLDLLNISGTGLINRIWITIDDRTPEMLRALRIDMYWDDLLPALQNIAVRTCNLRTSPGIKTK